MAGSGEQEGSGSFVSIKSTYRVLAESRISESLTGSQYAGSHSISWLVLELVRPDSKLGHLKVVMRSIDALDVQSWRNINALVRPQDVSNSKLFSVSCRTIAHSGRR